MSCKHGLPADVCSLCALTREARIQDLDCERRNILDVIECGAAVSTSDQTKSVLQALAEVIRTRLGRIPWEEQ